MKSCPFSGFHESYHKREERSSDHHPIQDLPGLFDIAGAGELSYLPPPPPTQDFFEFFF